MADRPPASRPGRPAERPAEPPAEDRSLTARWWWQAAVVAVTGLVLVGFQWEVIRAGEAIPATWVMVGIGAVVAVVGLVWAWRSRPDREA